MAEDHRYSWLDDSAAERLLRGEPVEGQPAAPDGRSDQSYADAERLAAVLSAAAGAGRAAAPSDASALPGEEAAVAAFRAARVEAGAQAGAEAGAGSVAEVAEMDMARRPHRIRRFRERQPRLRRPLRAGMVAVVAGCALSGFAVAAAAGVLPTPFGQSDHTPGPSVSMSNGGSGGDSAHPEISQDGGTTAPDPSGSGDNDASDVGSNGAQGGTVPSDPEDDGKGKNGKGPGSSNGNPGVPKWALAVCPRYLDSETGVGADLDKKSLKKLTKAAGSASAIHGYCTQILADDGTGSTPRSDESTGSGGDGGGTDSGNGGSDGSGSGSGSGSGDSAGSDSGGGSGGDPGKAGGDGDTAPPPPPPDTTDTPTDVTTPTTAADPLKSTEPPASGDPTTAAETGAD
ncbi:hypothetical protein [Streptomyces rapamycinicus]|uniref:Extensin n=2 Tax=Streptomyces rapamycinicus TaxID=1226757 RepID=A0A0A0NRI9_STRRN|nr:hypothetical protein [Streptomyces rapamycinicus]AGP57185.1 hypothetical protein M271_28650 [Streptomyces rapamycinicus NRRL 5491]MBB4784827.1 hypothetical protein [Streptomyces rapamycinicus]RLV79696.1 hypothetical protein D3C57_114965 [Streptomyces rapamycinicus NRRL 5491]UTO65081.1 hypothetical protein LJB45_24005 [Streptomyces rapamycinicus]UTP33037.1 hypothetical protein LIV37_29130 [Streptomyces rapamycinicus NRRL 5491]